MEFTFTFLKLFVWSVYLIAPLLVILSAIVILLGQVVTHIEKWDRFDGLYWSLITATTVGYGDIRPLTKLSKALSVLIAIFGMMFTGLLIAIMLQATAISVEKHIDPVLIERIKADLDNAAIE